MKKIVATLLTIIMLIAMIPAAAVSIGDTETNGTFVSNGTVGDYDAPEQLCDEEAEKAKIKPAGGAALLNNPVTVTFVGNGGFVDGENNPTMTRTIEAGASVGALMPIGHWRPGFAFRHWNTVEADMGLGNVFTGATIVSGDINVYAQWGLQVEFNLQAPEMTPLMPIIVPEGMTADDTEGVTWPTPTRPGFVFDGWSTHPQLLFGDEIFEDTPIIKNMALYAHWDPAPPFTVTFNAAPGDIATGHQATRQARQGISIHASSILPSPYNLNVGVAWPQSAPQVAALPNPNVLNGNLDSESPNLTLAGWSTEPYGGGIPNWAGNGSAAVMPVYDDMNVYARWVYRVQFNANLGTIASVDTIRDIVVSPTTQTGGTIAANGVNSVGATNTTLPTTTRAGFEFEGWWNMNLPVNTCPIYAVDVLGARRFFETCEVNSSGQVWALWHTDTEVTVTFDTQGGDWVSATRTVPVNGTIASRWGTGTGAMPTFPTRDGFVFTGWFSNDDGTGAQFSNTTIVTEDMTVYARWESYFTVTIDANGGTPVANRTRRIAQGRTFEWMQTLYSIAQGAPVSNYYFIGTLHNHSGINWDTQRANHEFFLWNTESDGSGTRFLGSSPIDGDMTIYAMWGPQITFDSNREWIDGLTNATTTRNVIIGRSFVTHHLHPNTPNTSLVFPTPGTWGALAVPDHSFRGWNTCPDETGDWFDPTTIVENDGPFTLYAIWGLGVSFNPGLAPMDTIEPENATREDFVPGVPLGPAIPGDPPTGMPPDPIWIDGAGYTVGSFRGWNTRIDGQGTWVTYTTDIPTPWTLFAMWNATVNFCPNGGDIISGNASELAHIGEPMDNRFPTVSRENWTFAEWNSAPDGSGVAFTATAPDVLSTMTLYAQWQGTVTFDLNGGNISGDTTNPTRDVRENSNVAATTLGMPADPTITGAGSPGDGYIFSHWECPEGEEFDGTTLMTDGHITVIARFKLDPAQRQVVTFNPNGGTFTGPDAQPTRDIARPGAYGQAFDADGNLVNPDLPRPTRPGWNFGGWFSSLEYANGTTQNGRVLPGDAVTDALTRTLYARWTWIQTGGLPPVITPPNNNITIQPPSIPLGQIPLTPYHHAFLVGFSDDTVRPRQLITRAEVATIFFRLLDDGVRTKQWSQDNPFSDVNINNWHNNAISTMTNLELLQGLPDGTFQPNRPITRGEFVAIMARFVDDTGMDLSDHAFDDIRGHWAEHYIHVLAELDWVRGNGAGSFRPNDHMTRAEAAAATNRMLNRILESPESKQGAYGEIRWFSDNMDESSWYFLYMKEATHSTEFTRAADGNFVVWERILPHIDWSVLERPDSQPGDLTRLLEIWRAYRTSTSLD